MFIVVCAAHLTAQGCSYVCQICWAHWRCSCYHHSHSAPRVGLQRGFFFLNEKNNYYESNSTLYG